MTALEMYRPVYEGNGDSMAALAFKLAWSADQLFYVTAIDPKTKKIESASFGPHQDEEFLNWLSVRNGWKNLYFQVNQPSENAPSKIKFKRDDITHLKAFHVDIDARPNHPLSEELWRIVNSLENFELRPSVVVYTGGGFAAYWLLGQPIVISNPGQMERINIAIAKQLGGDHCHNLDRIMRLPGTVNIPNQKKFARGRIRALAETIWFN